jgi:hypothetical protein
VRFFCNLHGAVVPLPFIPPYPLGLSTYLKVTFLHFRLSTEKPHNFDDYFLRNPSFSIRSDLTRVQKCVRFKNTYDRVRITGMIWKLYSFIFQNKDNSRDSHCIVCVFWTSRMYLWTLLAKCRQKAVTGQKNRINMIREEEPCEHFRLWKLAKRMSKPYLLYYIIYQIPDYRRKARVEIGNTVEQ